MADDLDALLQGKDEDTSSVSQTEIKTQATDSSNPIEGGAEQQEPEEAEWRSLKGPTQDRIKRLIQEKKAQEAENARLRSAVGTVPPPPPGYGGQSDPNVQDAVRKLDQVGLATKDFVKESVDQSVGNLRWQFEIERLESKYSGDDGRPKFDREEYQDYIGRHPEYRSYLPEDVYDKMYHEELHDWDSQQTGGKVLSRNKTLRPTRTTSGGEEPLTPELIEARLREPDGRAWYEKNIEKINTVLGRPPKE